MTPYQGDSPTSRGDDDRRVPSTSNRQHDAHSSPRADTPRVSHRRADSRDHRGSLRVANHRASRLRASHRRGSHPRARDRCPRGDRPRGTTGTVRRDAAADAAQGARHRGTLGCSHSRCNRAAHRWPQPGIQSQPGGQPRAVAGCGCSRSGSKRSSRRTSSRPSATRRFRRSSRRWPRRDVGSVVVVEDDQPVGVVTDRSVVALALENTPDIASKAGRRPRQRRPRHCHDEHERLRRPPAAQRRGYPPVADRRRQRRPSRESSRSTTSSSSWAASSARPARRSRASPPRLYSREPIRPPGRTAAHPPHRADHRKGGRLLNSPSFGSGPTSDRGGSIRRWERRWPGRDAQQGEA